jgi:GNAT superfamily N-acetyltransferase
LGLLRPKRVANQIAELAARKNREKRKIQVFLSGPPRGVKQETDTIGPACRLPATFVNSVTGLQPLFMTMITDTPGPPVLRLHSLDDRQADALADVLIDCVEGGASVSFMPPLSRERALAYWRHIAEGLAAGRRALLVAEDALGICGTVQLVLDLPENQPHRADLVKMLVHGRARRRGVGASLMRAAEAVALECGRTLLVLDAVTGGDGFRLYERLGWVRVGDVPRFALMPDGRPCSTTYFYRDLAASPATSRLEEAR